MMSNASFLSTLSFLQDSVSHLLYWSTRVLCWFGTVNDCLKGEFEVLLGFRAVQGCYCLCHNNTPVWKSPCLRLLLPLLKNLCWWFARFQSFSKSTSLHLGSSSAAFLAIQAQNQSNSVSSPQRVQVRSTSVRIPLALCCSAMFLSVHKLTFSCMPGKRSKNDCKCCGVLFCRTHIQSS